MYISAFVNLTPQHQFQLVSDNNYELFGNETEFDQNGGIVDIFNEADATGTVVIGEQ